MTVPSRRATPSLLQVDSIKHHVHGRDATSEVCRFLLAEFSHYRWVGVFRIEAEELELDAEAGEGRTEPDRFPSTEGLLGETAKTGATQIRVPSTPAGSDLPRIAVPIRTAQVVDGVLAVTGRTATSLDASDARFLEQVAGKLTPEMAIPRNRLL